MITKSKLNVLLLLILLNHKNSISALSPCPTLPRFLNSCNTRKLVLQRQEAAVDSWVPVVWLTQGPPLTPALLSTSGRKTQRPHSCTKPQYAMAIQAWFPGKAEFTSPYIHPTINRNPSNSFYLYLEKSQMVKDLPAMQKTQVQSLRWKDPLWEGMATHSSILAWETPWTQEPGGL